MPLDYAPKVCGTRDGKSRPLRNMLEQSSWHIILDGKVKCLGAVFTPPMPLILFRVTGVDRLT